MGLVHSTQDPSPPGWIWSVGWDRGWGGAGGPSKEVGEKGEWEGSTFIPPAAPCECHLGLGRSPTEATPCFSLLGSTRQSRLPSSWSLWASPTVPALPRDLPAFPREYPV